MLWSSLETNDDDAAIQAFDLAVEALQSALKMDPTNEGIRQQLADMDIFHDEDIEKSGGL